MTVKEAGRLCSFLSDIRLGILRIDADILQILTNLGGGLTGDQVDIAICDDLYNESAPASDAATAERWP